MLNIFKRKEKTPEISSPELLAVIDGKLIEMEKVKDPVFAQKTIGDGFAIESTGSMVYAPHDGVVSMLFPTNHAIGLTFSDGMEVLIHIGIDTVNENGKGFQSRIKLDAKVKAGDPLMCVDREYLKSRGYDLTTIIIFTDADKYASFTCPFGTDVQGGKDIAATYSK